MNRYPHPNGRERMSSMSEIEESQAGRISGILALGRRMAEQHQRDGGSSYALASLALAGVSKQAMQAAADQEQYYAKCHALGISMDSARQILTDTIEVAEQRGLPTDWVWERAWQQAIEKSAPTSSGLEQDPWRQLLNSWGATRAELDAIGAGLLALAGQPNDEDTR